MQRGMENMSIFHTFQISTFQAFQMLTFETFQILILGNKPCFPCLNVAYGGIIKNTNRQKNKHLFNFQHAQIQLRQSL